MASPPTPNVTFLIVPGSFTTPPVYDTLVAQLQNQGYNARATALLSANDGSRQPPATGDDDAAHIRSEVLALLDGTNATGTGTGTGTTTAPTNVILAAHSYGGMPGTSALRGLGRADRAAQGHRTAVLGLVYLASFVLPLGQSSRAFLNAEAGDMPAPARVGVPGGYLPALELAFAKDFLGLGQLGEGAEGAEAVDELLGHFTRHSSDSFNHQISYEAWKDIPSVYLIPDNDLVIPTALQLAMCERAVAAGGKITKVVVEGAGHVLNFTHPKLVAAEMIKLAEAQSSEDQA